MEPILPIVWIDRGNSSFPHVLLTHLDEQAPKRIAAFGNLELLTSKPLALICSVKCPGTIILQTYDMAQKLRDAGVPVIGGFHSPMEQECLRILLRGTQPVIVCPARGLQGMRIPKEYKVPLDQGRLLLLSSFSETKRRVTVDTAIDRNYFVAAIADRIFVPHAAPSSKTFELCRAIELWKKPLYTPASEANAGLLKIGAHPVDASGGISGLIGP